MIFTLVRKCGDKVGPGTMSIASKTCQDGNVAWICSRLTRSTTLPACTVPERCMISAVVDLSKHYVYGKDPVVLSSDNLVKSLQSKYIYY